MWRLRFLLLPLAATSLLPPIAKAYRIPFKTSKFHEGGLPSQHGAIDVQVGHLATNGIGRSDVLAILDEAWQSWDSFLDCGLAWRSHDVGDQALPWAEDGQNTVQFVPDGGTWGGVMRTYGGLEEPWRVEEFDLMLRECPEWCWVHCPDQCAGERGEVDLPTVLRHELGHAIGLKHCASCSPDQTLMLPFYDAGTCTVWNLGSEDEIVSGDTYRHGSDSEEPSNDLWASPTDIGSLDGALTYDDTWADAWLTNVLDVDIWRVTVLGDPTDSRLSVAVVPPGDLDVAIEIYQGSIPVVLVDDGGTAQPEFFDAPAEAGDWRARVFCPDYSSNTWSEDPYDVQFALYRSVAAVTSARDANGSMSILESPSPSPRITLQGIADGATLRVVDVKGRTVLHQRVDGALHEWSATELPSGVYLATLRQGSSVTRRSFTVVR